MEGLSICGTGLNHHPACWLAPFAVIPQPSDFGHTEAGTERLVIQHTPVQRGGADTKVGSALVSILLCVSVYSRLPSSQAPLTRLEGLARYKLSSRPTGLGLIWLLGMGSYKMSSAGCVTSCCPHQLAFLLASVKQQFGKIIKRARNQREMRLNTVDGSCLRALTQDRMAPRVWHHKDCVTCRESRLL